MEDAIITVPPEIVELTNLNSLHIVSCLSGPFPSDIGRLTGLKILHMISLV